MTLDVVLHPTNQPGLPLALADVPGVRLLTPADDDGVTDALRAAPVLLTRRWRDDFLSPALRWVQTLSSGCELFPVEQLRHRDIVLTTASGTHPVVAEHAVGLLLALLRDLNGSIRDMASRHWQPRITDELGGRTVVVAGLGAIGRAVATRLAPFDVRLIGVTRSPERHRAELGDVRPLTDLASATAEASVLIVTLPAARETQHIVSGEVLGALGDGWLINVGRGPVVDEIALVSCLTSGALRGAGLDVMEIEPLPATSPLWRLPNVICTPHRAGLAPGYIERMAALLATNLAAYRGAGRWRNRVC
jgi:phosphoglycerate dehydrogenase-like enzyme